MSQVTTLEWAWAHIVSSIILSWSLREWLSTPPSLLIWSSAWHLGVVHVCSRCWWRMPGAACGVLCSINHCSFLCRSPTSDHQFLLRLAYAMAFNGCQDSCACSAASFSTEFMSTHSCTDHCILHCALGSKVKGWITHVSKRREIKCRYPLESLLKSLET